MHICVFMYAAVKKCILLCTQVYFLYNKVYISNIQTYFCILCYTGNVLVYTEVYTTSIHDIHLYTDGAKFPDGEENYRK